MRPCSLLLLLSAVIGFSSVGSTIAHRPSRSEQKLLQPPIREMLALISLLLCSAHGLNWEAAVEGGIEVPEAHAWDIDRWLHKHISHVLAFETAGITLGTCNGWSCRSRGDLSWKRANPR